MPRRGIRTHPSTTGNKGRSVATDKGPLIAENFRFAWWLPIGCDLRFRARRSLPALPQRPRLVPAPSVAETVVSTCADDQTAGTSGIRCEIAPCAEEELGLQRQEEGSPSTNQSPAEHCLLAPGSSP